MILPMIAAEKSNVPMTPNAPPTPSPNTDYDVVVIGGAFSGAAFATYLRRINSASRVLVVEGAERFLRRVGEATVEVSACFLHRVLRLDTYLARNHLPKHGLRYWFTDEGGRSLHEMTEVGPRAVPQLPSFQLDRARLDEHLLATAEAEGSEVMRPARVKKVDLEGPVRQVEIEDAEGSRRTVTTRWVIDASGRTAFLARRMRLLERTERHPTAAAWGRWTGTLDLDGVNVLGGDPGNSRLPETVAVRSLATNHFCGYGWWTWVIPLVGGETSIGLVYDKTLFELPGEGPIEARYRDFIRSQDGLRELVEQAEPVEGDFMAYRHLPYRSKQYMGPGWALLGDAASFIDPYYSPGLDHASISVYATARLVAGDLGGCFDAASLDAAMIEHNAAFDRSYDRWLDALYEGKYEILGDADLTRCAFILDTALYYAGVVTPVYDDLASLATPLFGRDDFRSRVPYKFMRFYNQRLRQLARQRRHAGTYGRSNVGQRRLSKAFAPGRSASGPFIWHGLKLWARLEAEGLAHRLRHGPIDLSQPVRTSRRPVTAS